MTSNRRARRPRSSTVAAASPSMTWDTSRKPRVSRLRRTMAHAPGERSTKTQKRAPRESASSPTLPVPQYKSRNNASGTKSERILNRALRTKSRIGRIPPSSHGTSLRPRRLPLMILMSLHPPSSEAMLTTRFSPYVGPTRIVEGGSPFKRVFRTTSRRSSSILTTRSVPILCLSRRF